jgi:L-2-hydroxycarboxylate dehydrogenase (NAD+)
VKQVTAYLDAIRACRPIEGAMAVTVPGDRTHACRERRLAEGISIADEVWNRLQELAGEWANP